MKLPAAVVEEVEAIVQASGLGRSVASVQAVAGGCISETACVQLDTDASVFLKWSDDISWSALYEAERDALAAIASTGAVRVPTVYGVGVRAPCIVLEWLAPGRLSSDGWRVLGESLAAMHRHSAAAFGWSADNFIGSLQQANPRTGDWSQFWRNARLAPQLELALSHGRIGRSQQALCERALDACDAILREVAEPPSLLHGDLWNGNVHPLRDGTAALIDPGAYFGHREVDLAMAELFGGFALEFHDAYRRAWPVSAEYARIRKDVYQLYYVLVHVNLFGGSYVDSALGLMRRITASA